MNSRVSWTWICGVSLVGVTWVASQSDSLVLLSIALTVLVVAVVVSIGFLYNRGRGVPRD